MIKSLSELSCSPNVRPNSASNNRHLFFLLLYHCSSVLTSSVLELNCPVGVYPWHHPASSASLPVTFCLACSLMLCNYKKQAIHVWEFRCYSLLTTLHQQWLDLVQPGALFVFSSSTASVKILGLLPLFAAFDSQVNFAFFLHLVFFVVVVLFWGQWKGKPFLCVYSFSDSPFADCGALVLLQKQLLFYVILWIFKWVAIRIFALSFHL